jgi:hypothetical protein
MDLKKLLDALKEAENNGSLAALQATDPATPVDETTEVEQLAAELADHRIHPLKLRRVLLDLDARLSRVEDHLAEVAAPATVAVEAPAGGE